MIRLIASDMDGTLLDDDSRVPEETYELIEALAEKGVRFVATMTPRTPICSTTRAPISASSTRTCPTPCAYLTRPRRT